MSFILDAIAKSERERQQQEIPDVRMLAIPVSAAQRPQGKLIFYVIGALLLSAIVLFIWVQTDRSAFNRLFQLKNSSTQIEATDNADLPIEMPTVEIMDSTASTDQGVEFNLAKARTTGVKTSAPIPKPLTTKSAVLKQALVEPNDLSPSPIEDNPGASEIKFDKIPSHQIANSRNGDSIQSVAIQPNTQPGFIPPAQRQNQTPMENTLEPAPRKITRLNELPAEIRRDLPSVAFTGHLFSKNVNLSYVMVDGGRSVIAGQQIADELFLHKVTPNGAIVDFRGYLIETGILQNWSLK